MTKYDEIQIQSITAESVFDCEYCDREIKIGETHIRTSFADDSAGCHYHTACATAAQA